MPGHDHYEALEQDAPDYRVLKEAYLVARKAHRCAHCRGAIRPGQRYFYHVYMYDGEFKAEASHSKGALCVLYEAET
jgi:hypothetical protein